jgi:hypothetical protein
MLCHVEQVYLNSVNRIPLNLVGNASPVQVGVLVTERLDLSLRRPHGIWTNCVPADSLDPGECVCYRWWHNNRPSLYVRKQSDAKARLNRVVFVSRHSMHDPCCHQYIACYMPTVQCCACYMICAIKHLTTDMTISQSHDYQPITRPSANHMTISQSQPYLPIT